MKITCITPKEYAACAAQTPVSYGFTATPVGEAMLAWCDQGLCYIGFVADRFDQDALIEDLVGRWPGSPLTEDTSKAAELAAIVFDPAQKNFDRLCIALKGTPFQIKVWEELLKIPFGQTVSYSDIAAATGRPTAVRAAASAVGRNDLSYLVPCHRVLRSDGSIGGYYWGLPCKRIILLWEEKNR